MTTEEIKRLSESGEMMNAVLIGNVDERENYYPAIVEADKKRGVFVYDYGLLVECFAKMFKDWNAADPTFSEDDAFTSAVEWVDYNVIRALPYLGEYAPIIRGEEDDE